MATRSHLDHAVVNSFLRGLEYPITKAELVQQAQANDLTGPYLEALQALPQERFTSQQEVMDALQRKGYRLS